MSAWAYFQWMGEGEGYSTLPEVLMQVCTKTAYILPRNSQFYSQMGGWGCSPNLMIRTPKPGVTHSYMCLCGARDAAPIRTINAPFGGLGQYICPLWDKMVVREEPFLEP